MSRMVDPAGKPEEQTYNREDLLKALSVRVKQQKGIVVMKLVDELCDILDEDRPGTKAHFNKHIGPKLFNYDKVEKFEKPGFTSQFMNTKPLPRGPVSPECYIESQFTPITAQGAPWNKSATPPSKVSIRGSRSSSSLVDPVPRVFGQGIDVSASTTPPSSGNPSTTSYSATPLKPSEWETAGSLYDGTTGMPFASDSTS